MLNSHWECAPCGPISTVARQGNMELYASSTMPNSLEIHNQDAFHCRSMQQPNPEQPLKTSPSSTEVPNLISRCSASAAVPSTMEFACLSSPSCQCPRVTSGAVQQKGRSHWPGSGLTWQRWSSQHSVGGHSPGSGTAGPSGSC